MLGKRSRPGIGKLTGTQQPGIVDLATSPRSPLECKMYPSPTPRGLKNYDQGGVGLAIVVALDDSKNGSGQGEVLAKYALCGPISTRSSPIPVIPCPDKNKHGMYSGNNNLEMIEGLDEEVTYVTCHGPNNSVTTKVYYDDGQYGNTMGHNRIGRKVSVFNISPVRLFDEKCGSDTDSDSDFLSSCYLCRKSLHGKDIYMYRGEKAFCSAECRESQIGKDERKEKCRLEASRSSDVVSSSSSSSSPSPLPYSFSTSRGQIFSPGIVAA